MTEPKSLARAIARVADLPRVHNMNTAAFEASPYGARALEEECRLIAESKQGERNTTLNCCTFRVAQLVAGGEIPEGEADRELRRAARACGLTDREARATIESAFRGGRKNPRSAPPREFAASIRHSESGPDAADEWTANDYETWALEEPDSRTQAIPLHEIGGTGEQSTDRRWSVLSTARIFERLPPIKYLLEALDICPGAPTLVAGYGFSGKTIALQSAALAIAAGARVWGTFRVPVGRVLHIDHEQGEHLTRKRYQRLAAAMLLCPADFQERLALAPMPGVYLDSAEAEAVYMEKCAGFDLVIIDSLRAACPALEENDSGARRVLDMLNRVSDRTGACFVVVHHARKPHRDSAGGAKASIRGSGAIFDACGSVLVFDGQGKGQPVRVAHEKARTSGRLADDFLLRIEDAEVNGEARGGLSVTAEAIAATAADSGKALDGLKERVRTYFREHGDQPSKNALCERLGGRRQTVYAALAELEAAGEIVNTSTEKKPTLHLVEAPKP